MRAARDDMVAHLGGIPQQQHHQARILIVNSRLFFVKQKKSERDVYLPLAFFPLLVQIRDLIIILCQMSNDPLTDLIELLLLLLLLD